MANENQSVPQVAIPLPKGKKTAVELGGICLMLFVAFAGLSLSMIQAPVLEAMGGSQYFSMLTIFASLGLAIMTPVGGKLGDMFGRRNVIMISGLCAAVCTIGLGVAYSIKSVALFMVMRLLLGAAQGAFTAAPYIILGEINERKDVPKGMGLLTTAITVGGFAGSILAGILVDAGQTLIAIVFPVIPLAIALVLIGANLPNKRSANKPVIDWSGIAVLAVFLTALLLSLNLGANIGWTDPKILAGFAVAIIAAIALVKVENKVANPLIPMRLFKNGRYTILVLLGWICYFYQTAMNTYAPLALMNVVGASATITGVLQLPRTVFSMIMPVIVGGWVAKKKDRSWKAMAISTGLLTIAFLPLAFTSPSTSPILFIVLIGVTGIADAFKSVTITPSAQATLEPADIGIGTSLITFVNSTASLFAGAINGVLLDMNGTNIQAGVDMVLGFSAAVCFAGLLMVLLVIRKQMTPKA